MGNKQIVNLDEKQLRQLIKESMKRMLREIKEIEDVKCYDILNNNFDGSWNDVLMARLYNENDECVGVLRDLHFKYDTNTGKLIRDSLI